MVLTGRKPRLLFRLSGVVLLRFAERQFLALLFQLPPAFPIPIPARVEAGPPENRHPCSSVVSLLLLPLGVSGRLR